MTDAHISRRSAVGLLAGLALATSGASAGAQEKLKGTGEVVVYDGGGAWGAAQKAAFFDPFEKSTGIKVIAAAQMPVGPVRTSVTAGAPAYDVMDLPGAYIDSFVKDGMLEPIDYSLFEPGDKEAFSPIPATDYMLPSLFYSLVMAYDKEAFHNDAPKTWSDMWNAKKFPGKRALYNAGDDAVSGALFETALMADGVDAKSVYPIDFDRAFRSLDKIKPDVLRFWTAGAEAAQLLTDGSVAMSSAWNGRISALQRQRVPVDLSWNQAVLQWDAWTVLKGAKNKGNAMKFLAFVAEPAQQAKFSELIEYGPTNSKTFKVLSAERAAILPGNPDSVQSQLVQNYSWWNQDSGDGKSNIEHAAELWQKWISK